MDELKWAHTETDIWYSDDLNRIEEWTSFLAGKLIDEGYLVNVNTGIVWDVSSVPTQSDINRMRDNVVALRDAYANLPGWREIVYNNTVDFSQVNAMEWDLHLIYTWLQAMVNAYQLRQANTLFMQAGGVLNA